jgi:hypothetical protein
MLGLPLHVNLSETSVRFKIPLSQLRGSIKKHALSLMKLKPNLLLVRAQKLLLLRKRLP